MADHRCTDKYQDRKRCSVLATRDQNATDRPEKGGPCTGQPAASLHSPCQSTSSIQKEKAFSADRGKTSADGFARNSVPEWKNLQRLGPTEGVRKASSMIQSMALRSRM